MINENIDAGPIIDTNPAFDSLFVLPFAENYRLIGTKIAADTAKDKPG